MSMPRQKPGKSRQDFGTPDELLDAVELRFGAITWDVAADADNAVIDGERFFSAGGVSALDDDWSKRFKRTDLLWLNPPFGAISHAWAPLVARWTAALPWLRLVMLTPASVGSEWFRLYAHGRAMVLGLNPRITFVGETTPYPKDCMLSCYGFGVAGFDVWRWQPTAVERRAERKRLRTARAA